MQGQGRSRAGGRGGGGGYQYRHGYQPYAAGWQTYHHQGGYVQQPVQGFAPLYGRPGGGGVAARGILPLGVHGAGILKRPVGPAQGPLLHGRGHQRGGGGRGGGRGGWGGRGRDRGGRDKERDQKPLTKEALDADLDEWRMKDKKLGGQSLDADLDDYWKKKEDDPSKEDDEELSETAEVAETSRVDNGKASKVATKKASSTNGDRKTSDKASEPSSDGEIVA